MRREKSAFAFSYFFFLFDTSPMNQFLEVDVNRVSNSGFFFSTMQPRRTTTASSRKRTEAVLRTVLRSGGGAAAPSWYYIYCSRSSIHSSEADVLCVVVCRLLSPQGLKSAARQAPTSEYVGGQRSSLVVVCSKQGTERGGRRGFARPLPTELVYG